MTYLRKTYFLLMSIAASCMMTACTSEEWTVENPLQDSRDGLSIVPTVFNGNMATKTRDNGETVEAEDVLNENLLESLDVFVTEAGKGDIIEQWHLTTPTASIESATRTLLATQWESSTSIEKNKYYDVYVAANNGQTKEEFKTVDKLMALSVTDTEIFKKYKSDATKTDDSPLTPSKTFTMDGTIKNWTPDNDAIDQVFEVDMKRAAAKIVVNVGFSQDFLDMQKYCYDEKKYKSDGTLVWTDADGAALAEGADKVEKPENKQTKITGSPAWRYVNFAANAPVFADGTMTADIQKIFRQNMFFGSLGSISGEDKSFTITTYSYPYAWKKASAINDAPFVMVSVEFQEYTHENKWESSYHYFRLPVCDESTVTALERNKIYIVNATIDSFGSTADNVDQEVKLEYEVLDWLTETEDNTNVIGKPLDFLMVSPLTFNLYGDGEQEVTLDAYAPNGKRVLVKDVTATWKDANGTTHTNDDKTVQTVPSEATNGKISVSSTVMDNHAVKTITFKVYLEGHEDDMVHQVTIKHFPVENIQNFEGSWSSKIGGQSYTYSKTNQTGYTQIGEVSKSSPGYLYTKSSIQITAELYNIFNNEGYSVTREWSFWGYRYYLNDYWYVYAKLVDQTWIDWNSDQTAHTTQKGNQDANFEAKMYNKAEGKIYPIYDNASGYQYKATTTDSVPRALSSQTNNHMYVVQISSTSDRYILGKPIMTKGANNGQYTQSDDDVVSPAFMIASQLGAVSTFTGDNAPLDAAAHCANYLEVGTDGTRYTGWRLPTASEIAVIANRQNDINYSDVITEVLAGQYYYNLSGGKSETGTNRDTESTYVRCVRDLTDEDLQRINGE